MIKKLINRKIDSITAAALILATASFASKILGLVRDRILAGSFGLGNELDIYFASFRVPDLIFNIVVLGAISAGFIPVFAKLISQKKEKEAFKTANAVLNLVMITLLFLCLLGIIFAPTIVALLTPGFTPEKKIITTELTRIMFLSPVFLLLSSITGGILQSYKRFFIYSLSPIMYNFGIIIGALYFAPIWGIRGLAWGVVLGSFLHFIVQLPIVRKLGFNYQFILSLKDSGARKIIKMMLPRTLTLVTVQLNLIVITIIASTLSEGSLSAFNFANNLQSFPLGLFAISFAVASFPTLSALSENKKEFAKSLTTTTKQILFFIIPVSILLLVLRAQIVRTIFGTGEIGWEETTMLLDAVAFFSISLFAQSIIPLFSRAFWALHDAKTPFLTSLFSVIINIILAFYLSVQYGIIGLVGAFSISAIINALLLYYLINRKTDFICHNRIYKPLLKISFAGIVSGYISYKTLYFIEPFLNTGTGIGIFLQGFIAGIVGLILYCVLSWLMKIEEFIIFKNSIQKRLFKTKIETTEFITED
ncbi:MAG: murein biosynthesis integral membrane protein MurJ [Candidatus Pacebacteria bacterium]|nr:murein biosynthesis integral membrane protein MurJ [Candidatus Paceibacterota bacterium]